MSFNSTNTPDLRGVLLFNGELILVYSPSVVVTFEKNNNQAANGKKNGSLYLTSHRVIFLNDNVSDELHSFEMPFGTMNDVTLEQPIFGSNYLKGFLSPPQGSNFVGNVPWRISFPKGGCIDFGHALLQAADMASRQNRPSNAPPPYAPPAGAFYAAPPDYCSAPQGVGSFQPPSTFPDRATNVFMHEAPPPYPGIAREDELPPPLPTETLIASSGGREAGQLPPAYESNTEGLRQRRT